MCPTPARIGRQSVGGRGATDIQPEVLVVDKNGGRLPPLRIAPDASLM
jgi:hypothetical protein